MLSRRQNAASASAAAAPPTLFHQEDDQWQSVMSSRPPTRDLLRALTALPSGGLNSTSARKSKSKSGAKNLAREGQIVSRFFSMMGPRPYPSNGLSLEQGVQLEMTYVVSAFTTSTTIGLPSAYSLAIALSSFAGSTALVTVFDQYRFDQVECWLENDAPNTANGFPQLTSAVDLDDATAPASFGAVEDHQGAVTGVGVGGHYHKWKPHTAVAVYSGAFTSFANTPAQWIDVASPNVQHYGFKAYAIAQSNTAFNYQITVRAVISFRAPVIN